MTATTAISTEINNNKMLNLKKVLAKANTFFSIRKARRGRKRDKKEEREKRTGTKVEKNKKRENNVDITKMR